MRVRCAPAARAARTSATTGRRPRRSDAGGSTGSNGARLETAQLPRPSMWRCPLRRRCHSRQRRHPKQGYSSRQRLCSKRKPPSRQPPCSRQPARDGCTRPRARGAGCATPAQRRDVISSGKRALCSGRKTCAIPARSPLGLRPAPFRAPPQERKSSSACRCFLFPLRFRLQPAARVEPLARTSAFADCESDRDPTCLPRGSDTDDLRATMSSHFELTSCSSVPIPPISKTLETARSCLILRRF